jgi:hypothetical protein
MQALNTTPTSTGTARPGRLRLAGPVRHGGLLALVQALAILLAMAYAIALLAGAWAAGQALAGPALPWLGALLFALLAALAALGSALPLALAAGAGAWAAWHWHPLAAALLALPQLATWLPGLVAASIARLRHG